jgi:hypothetical protein
VLAKYAGKRYALVRRSRRGVMCSPGSEPVPVEVRADRDELVVKIPSLDLWAVLELSGEKTVRPRGIIPP